MKEFEHFKTGDRVRITFQGRSREGLVKMASGNGVSLFLEWDDGMLGGYCGQMPVMWESVEFRDLICNDVVEVEYAGI